MSDNNFYAHTTVFEFNYRAMTLRGATLYLPNVSVLPGCDAATLALYLPAHVVLEDQ
jgi:hypothetical protein